MLETVFFLFLGFIAICVLVRIATSPGGHRSGRRGGSIGLDGGQDRAFGVPDAQPAPSHDGGGHHHSHHHTGHDSGGFSGGYDAGGGGHHHG